MGIFTKKPTSRMLNDVGTLLVGSGVKVERKTQSLSFRGRIGETRIEVVPSGHRTPDQRVVAETIRIQSDLKMPSLPWGEDMQCVLNTSASNGALFMEDGRVFIKSRLSLYESESTQVTKIYAGVIFFVAMTHTDAMQAAIVDMLKLPVAKVAVPSDREADNGWNPASFVRAASLLNESGAFANGDEGGFTAEFPWDPGAVSALTSLITGSRKCTSLLQVRCDEHPNLGKGLLCRVDLPLRLTDTDAFRLSINLNQMEFSAENWPPFLGAWTSMPKSGNPTFVSFWPNLFAKVIDVELIATWMAARARLLPGWLRDNTGVKQ